MERAVLILLVGEQAQSNLLPTRYLKPETAVLVHTEKTKGTADRLKAVLTDCRCLLCSVDPYDWPKIQQTLQELVDQQLAGRPLVFNITGGTKPMSLGAFLVALRCNARLVYLQTEGYRSSLYHYEFAGDGHVKLQQRDEIRPIITLDDFLRTQLGGYRAEDPRDEFERQVYQTLRSVPDLEVVAGVRPRDTQALQIDFVLRLGNQVGVMESKTKGAKRGIDQIQAAAEQRYLGTYVAKFLVSAHPVDRNNKALARAYNISVIELPGFAERGMLSSDEQAELVHKVRRGLGATP